MSSLRPVLSALAAYAALGCDGGGEGLACRVAADCPSGVCLAEGRCQAGEVASASSTGGGSGGGAAGCVPDGDGVVRRDEVVVGPGLHARFRVAKDALVDTAGVANADGTRAWDLSAALAGDVDVDVDTLPLDGLWFAGEYPGATFASPLGSDSFLGALHGVFETTADALLLRGVVSLEGGPLATRLTHAPGIRALLFPLEVGASWPSSATVSGAAKGVPAFFSEAYSSKVDARGTLATPYGTFPVLRVATTLTRNEGPFPTVRRSFAFVAECYGTIATVSSHPSEPAVEFTFAADVRRLAP